MSVASEIQRIIDAKTAIANAISNKGVTVPAGTQIDGMPALINQISTGTTVQEHSGTFTLDSNGSVTVDLGFVPDVVTVMSPTSASSQYGQASTANTANFKAMRPGDVVSWTYGVSDSQYVAYYIMVASQTANGFKINFFGYMTSSWQAIPLSGYALDYKAVKFS